MSSPRIAWLLTSAFYYWHPMLSYLTRLFPQTTAFAAKWQGYAPTFENSFTVDVVGKRKIISLAKSETGYGNNFTWMSLAIVNRLLKFKPQVVFSNSFGMWTALALLFKPIGKWRVVIAYEGSSPSVDYCNSPWRLSLRRAMVHAADACITNSCAGKTYLIEKVGAGAERVFVQPYEVPCAEALFDSGQSVAWPLQLQHPTFLFVGNLSPRKGLHLLLNACVSLKQEGIDNYTLLIVGDGSQRQQLEAFCQEHEIDACVQWMGRVDYGALGKYFNQADVFVLPTLEDTWGVVVLEAMTLGKPVLCSRHAGASELIKDGKNGFCFDPVDTPILAEMMKQFIHHPELAASLGETARDTMQFYSPEAAAQFLSTVTQFVLQNSPIAISEV